MHIVHNKRTEYGKKLERICIGIGIQELELNLSAKDRSHLSSPGVDIGRQALGVRQLFLKRVVKVARESWEAHVVAIEEGVEGKVHRGYRVFYVDLQGRATGVK